MNCTHPDHVAGQSCEDRSVGCNANCPCCVPQDGPLWLVEYYRKDPVTGDGGHTIHFAWVRAPDGFTASVRVSANDPLWDAYITITEHHAIVPLAMKEEPLIIPITAIKAVRSRDTV